MDFHLNWLALIASIGTSSPDISNALINESLANNPNFAAFLCLEHTW